MDMMRQLGAFLPTVILILVPVGSPTWAAGTRPQRGSRADLARIRNELGYVACRDGRVIFRNPYDRKKLDQLVGRVQDPQLAVELREWFLRLLTSVIKFWEVPATDMRDVVRPAVAKLVDDVTAASEKDPRLAVLAAEAGRCLWNADYALALAELGRSERAGKDSSKARAAAKAERLEQRARERMKSSRVDYLGDLVSWYLRLDTDVAAEKIAELAKSERRNWRVHLAREELRIRRELEKRQTDEQRATTLMKAAKDPDNPIPLQGWAVRTLPKYPTESAIKFLLELYDTAGAKGRGDLGREAKEALRLLKRLPEHGGHRYDRVE